MDKKKKVTTIVLVILCVGLVVSLISSTTYALFSSDVYGTNPNNYSTGLLLIEAKSKSETISLTNALPMADDDGKNTNPYVFTIKNTGNLDYVFNVKLLSTGDASNTFDSSYIKVQIDDGNAVTLSSLAGGVIKSDITLLAGESIDISIRAWLSIDTPNTEIGKRFDSKIVTDGQAVYTESNSEVNTAANYITNLYDYSVKVPVVNNSIVYYYDTDHNLMSDVYGNVRYYGASPNNYIYFNCSDYANQSADTCELWRIIGVFGDKVKIIRNESIGTFAWDNKPSGTGSSTSNNGSNDWTDARLMMLLNPGYETTSSVYSYEGSLYWNSKSGTCYSGENNATKSCDFTSTGLKNDTTRNMIEEVTWDLGGWDTSDIYSNQVYSYERGTTVYSGRPTSWTGKIALMYPSDYGYATDFTKCSQNLYNYNSSTDSYACRTNDWLYNSAAQWILTPSSLAAYLAWYASSAGYVNDGVNVYYAYGVRPVLYLNSKLTIGSGDGSSSSPYRLSVS